VGIAAGIQGLVYHRAAAAPAAHHIYITGLSIGSDAFRFRPVACNFVLSVSSGICPTVLVCFLALAGVATQLPEQRPLGPL